MFLLSLYFPILSAPLTILNLPILILSTAAQVANKAEILKESYDVSKVSELNRVLPYQREITEMEEKRLSLRERHTADDLPSQQRPTKVHSRPAVHEIVHRFLLPDANFCACFGDCRVCEGARFRLELLVDGFGEEIGVRDAEGEQRRRGCVEVRGVGESRLCFEGVS